MAANLFVRTAALNFAIYLANAYATDYGKNYIAAQSILMNIWFSLAFLSMVMPMREMRLAGNYSAPGITGIYGN